MFFPLFIINLVGICKAAFTKISSSGQLTDSPLTKWKKSRFGSRVVGIFATQSAILILAGTCHIVYNWKIHGKSLCDKSFFIERTKFQKFAVLDVPYEVQIILQVATINKFYKIRKITLQYTKNL